MDWLQVFLLSVLLAYVIYSYFTRTFTYWKDRNVVGPKPVPFFGNLISSALRRMYIGVVYKKIYDEFPNEKVVGVYRMTTPCLLIRDLDIIKHIMIKDFDCFSDRGISFSEDGLGANLFHAESETWRVLRNRFTPLFTSRKLKSMLYLMNEKGESLIRHISNIIINQQEQEIHSLVQKYTIATISACAFGLDIDMLSDKMETLNRIDKKTFTLTWTRELDMMYPGILKKFNKSFFPDETIEFFEQLVKTVLEQRNGVPSNRKDFMDLLLELRQKSKIHGAKGFDTEKQRTVELTDSIIVAQAFIFFAGGYETSAATMAFMLYELAKNTDIQDKLIKEIDEVLKKYNGEITYEMLDDMKYMQMVFDETLRMYPILDLLQRVAQIDYKIPDTDVVIKKYQKVLISPLSIHKDPKHFPNPNKFDPERFSPENICGRHPCAYLSFGVGPRNCIGMRFAKVQSRMCITKMLSNFRVEMSKNTPKNMEFSPKRLLIGPKNGIYLNIIPREVTKNTMNDWNSSY